MLQNLWKFINKKDKGYDFIIIGENEFGCNYSNCIIGVCGFSKY